MEVATSACGRGEGAATDIVVTGRLASPSRHRHRNITIASCVVDRASTSTIKEDLRGPGRVEGRADVRASKAGEVFRSGTRGRGEPRAGQRRGELRCPLHLEALSSSSPRHLSLGHIQAIGSNIFVAACATQGFLTVRAMSTQAEMCLILRKLLPASGQSQDSKMQNVPDQMIIHTQSAFADSSFGLLSSR